MGGKSWVTQVTEGFKVLLFDKLILKTDYDRQSE